MRVMEKEASDDPYASPVDANLNFKFHYAVAVICQSVLLEKAMRARCADQARTPTDRQPEMLKLSAGEFGKTGQQSPSVLYFCTLNGRSRIAGMVGSEKFADFERPDV